MNDNMALLHSPRGGGGAGTPLHRLYRYVRPQRVGFFSRFGHKYGIDFGHFAAILIINSVSIFNIILVLNLEDAPSLSCPPPSIRALPSSPLLNIAFNIGLNKGNNFNAGLRNRVYI